MTGPTSRAAGASRSRATCGGAVPSRPLPEKASSIGSAIADDAIAIARLPSDVRGYEDIKLANIKRYQQHLNELLDRFEREACAQ